MAELLSGLVGVFGVVVMADVDGDSAVQPALG